MQARKFRATLAATTAIALLTHGCGGGGGGSSSGGGGGAPSPPPSSSPPPSPSPSPAPTPTPTPPPPQTAAPFPPSNLTASQTFAALGYRVSYEYNGLTVDRSKPVNPNEPLVVRYNAVTGSYETELPGFAPGRLVLNATTGGRGYSLTNGLTSNALQGVFVNFFSGQISQTQMLTHSNLAAWDATVGGPFSEDDVIGYFAYGIPTPVEGIPAAGTLTYAFVGRGLTEAFNVPTSPDFRYLSAAGSLQLNFAQRTLTGTLKIASDELGREQDFGSFALSGVAIQADGSFAGSIVVPGSDEAGSFEGRFTGPGASEMIVRWRMPLLIASGGKAAQAYGVWVGKAS